jgi:hypothetical protein
MAEEDKEKKEETTAEQKSEDKPELLKEPIRVKDYLYLMMLSLDGKAWAYMDFIVHPETQKHEKDLGEAKLAIDAIDVIYKIVEPQLTLEQKKDLQARLTNLRLNFAKK